jgi:hypothetical protein
MLVGSNGTVAIADKRGIASLVPNLRDVNGPRVHPDYPSAYGCKGPSRFTSLVPEPGRNEVGDRLETPEGPRIGKPSAIGRTSEENRVQLLEPSQCVGTMVSGTKLGIQ